MRWLAIVALLTQGGALALNLGMMAPRPMAVVTRAAAFLSEASTLNSGFEFAFDDDDEDDDEDEEMELTSAQAAKRKADAAELDPGVLLTDRPADNLTVPELQAQLVCAARATGLHALLLLHLIVATEHARAMSRLSALCSASLARGTRARSLSWWSACS